ncbi:MAG TPA: carbon-nitrogen hydrolase family protein [Mycobacteriales bacterium]|nr:carbon-nitrogen hydrolase family protein [Mycobacteriales bacterium]
MRVAVVQFLAGEDKAHNLARLGELVGQAAALGATLVVAPECSMHGFGSADTPLAPVAEPLDGAFVTGLKKCASRHSVTVVAGMFEPVEGDAARAYNTVVAVGPDGELIGRYRKQHLFDALGWFESKRLEAGSVDERLVFDCGEFTVGVMTCYDVRFPELARVLVDEGVDLIALPSAWVGGPLKEHQWSTLVAARAIENVAYVVAADQPPPGFAGRAMVVDPFGVVLASLAEEEGVAVADVDPERVDRCREKMPSLEHRRYRVEPAD